MEAPSDAIFQRVLVTKPEVLGKSRAELGLEALFGVVLTRVIRGETEMPFTGAIRLQFGDTVQLVGTAEQVAAASHVLGNSVKALNQTHFIPMFLGIALGVILGTRPVEIPGLPVPLKLGLAGGPLVVSILLGRLGHFGRMIWHMPGSANVAFRELGISLFLACVGLKAGPHFFSAVFTESGAVWLASAVMITFVPLLTVGLFARLFLRMNFTAIMGLIAGSTTDPPALAFAGAISKSDAPAVAYATVYPLAMLLRILGAQAITLLLWR
jgi:putative transport protein